MAPLVFLIRHGQTEWSTNGRYTGTTEKELTETGRKEALALGDIFIGPKKPIDPSNLARIFVSPRVRATQTFELITKNYPKIREKAVYSEKFGEWDHGVYEGKTTTQIRASRAEQGLDKSSQWSIWTGGCEGGESVQDMTMRIKSVIDSVQEVQKDYMDDEKHGNVMIVGHGTFLRCLWKVWVGIPIDIPANLDFSTGSVAILSYKDNNVHNRIADIGLKMHSS